MWGWFKKKAFFTKKIKEINDQKKKSILGDKKESFELWSIVKKINYQISIFFIKDNIDYLFLQKELEKIMIQFDFGFDYANKLSQKIIEKIKYKRIKNHNELIPLIKSELIETYQNNITQKEFDWSKKNIWLICGCNGSGKTTSIAKLSYLYKNQSKRVLLIAGDTFRDGAVEQINLWAQKIDVDIIKPDKPKEDPSSLIYKGLNSSKEYDLVLCDTSGRQHNNENLMKEINKIYKVIKKFDIDAPQESLIVLDATQGQSLFLQSSVFFEYAKITGIILTKIDNINTGGIIFLINQKYNIPVKYICFGEDLNNIKPFDISIIVDRMINSISIN